MKIGLFGYGKMGKMVERLAAGRGHQVVARIDGPTKNIPFDQMDVAIDFSQPESAVENISQCLRNGVPVISGTTGWLAEFDQVTELCQAEDGAFLYASNFSLGVNLFFELNRHLAKLMSRVPGYSISLAEGIIAESDYQDWTLDKEAPGSVPIISERTKDVPGTHRIAYESEVDRIEIEHTAHNREGFAQGALLAAEWIVGKKGVYEMKDVLNLR
ncbi:MAG: dihydrodipicolinate reductase C-terminal domain-containing protein [Robiginitalea sp.]